MDNMSLEALAARLRTVADLFPTREAAALAAGVSNPQLFRYLNGTTKIPLIVAMRLAEAQSVSLDWLATGEGAQFGEVRLGKAANQS